MIRPPPISTLFPPHAALPIYLQSRRGPANDDDLSRAGVLRHRKRRDADGTGALDDDVVAPGNASAFDAVNGRDQGATGADRSEEHTSELQSQSNLVCRLLLD